MGHHLLKMSAGGNRFLIADKRWLNNEPPPGEWKAHSFKTKSAFADFLKLSALSASKRERFIKNLLSPPALSLTDGLVVLKENKKSALSCDFYNKDGSTAEMCGNAACCVSAYAEWISPSLKSFLFGRETVFRTAQGGISLKTAPAPAVDCYFAFHGRSSLSFAFIQPGAPHGVMECPIKGLAQFDNREMLKKIAQELRFKNPKSKKGMNISFFQKEERSRLKAISYERGVEGFTLACGTGALAVALVYLRKYQIKNLKTVFITMPGGQLKIQLRPKLVLFSPVKKGY